MQQNTDEYEIDLIHICMLLLSRIWMIVISTILCGALFLGYTLFFITPKYSSEALLHVNNNTISFADGAFSSVGLSQAKELINTYGVILQTRNTLNQVIERAGLKYSYGQLKNMVSVSSVGGTEIFAVRVVSTDPDEAEHIANTIAEVLPEKISTIVSGSTVSVVDYAVRNGTKISPNYKKYTLVGMAVGFAIASGIIILIDYFDDIIHDEDYLTECYDVPFLAAIPDTNASSGKNGYKYKYDYGYGYENASPKPKKGGDNK